MEVYEQVKAIPRIQKFRRIASYGGFYAFVALISYAYTSNTTRAGMSRADQYYAAYPAGIELLTDAAKLYKAALGNCFDEEDWGPIEFSIMAKHFDRQGKSPYAYHAHGILDMRSMVTFWQSFEAGNFVQSIRAYSEQTVSSGRLGVKEMAA